MEDLLSIITPTYNCARFICDTIESVKKQTYLNWEMLIVDDCSTDHTKQVVERYSKEDSRIKYFCLKSNKGAAVSRTIGMSLAKGKYIAFLDSDDLWMANKLKRQVNFMRLNHYNFTCTTYMQIDEKGRKNGKVIQVKNRVDYNGVLLSCPIGNSSVIFNADKLGKFIVPNIKKRNDDALWLQMLKKERYAYGLDEALMKYRVRQNSISSNKFDLVKYHWQLYRKIEKLTVARSIFHIGVWVVIKGLSLK